MRSVSGASLALAAALLSVTGCSAVGGVKALTEDREGNQEYRATHYAPAAALYEEALAAAPDERRIVSAYFYLANSYDRLYKPNDKGNPANDALLDKAAKYYDLASQKLGPTDNPPRSLALQYLAAIYGPGKIDDPVRAEPVFQHMIMLDPGDTANYFGLAKIYEDAGVDDEAEKIYLMAKTARPNEPAVYLQLAAFYGRQGEFDKAMAALEQRAEKEPTNPEAYHMIASSYWQETMHNGGLKDQVKQDHIQKGLQAEDKALQLNPDYVDALTYKGLLLRLEANVEKDPAKQQELLKQAEQIGTKANDVQHAGASKKS
jgi:tetratricopeptide (TPR) repeat protein